MPIGVFTRKDFGQYQSLNSLKGKKVGLIKNSFLSDTIKNMEDVILVELDSDDERFDALINKKVDVVLSTALNLSRLDSMIYEDIKLAGYFKHPEIKNEDLRFGIKKDQVLLASIINKSLNSISYVTMTLLKNEWILKHNKTSKKINFTKTEQNWIDTNKIIIGIEQAKPYIHFDKKKEDIDGLYADILKIVLKNTGLQTRYVTGEWSELLQNFKEQKIDLLPATFYKKSREKFGNFTSDFYKTREYIYVNKENDTIKAFSDIANKRVAIVKNYATIEKVKNKIPSVKIIETEDLEESITLLQTGQVDALIDYHLVVENYIRENFIVGLKSVIQSELESSSVHFFSNINKPILKSILQRGLDSITREDKNNILNSWISTPNDSIEMKRNIQNIKEQEFIKKHPIIKFRVRPDSPPPFEFFQNNEPAGTAVEYIKKSMKNIGLTAEFIMDNSSIKEAYNKVENRNGEFDTVLFTVKNKQRNERFSLGTDFLSYPMMIITHKNTPYIGSLNDLKNKTIVLEKGFLTNKWIKRDYPSIKIVNAKSTREAIKMLNDEKVVAYIGNLGVANYMTIFEDMSNIKVSAPSGYGNVKYSFMAPKQWPELTALLSKGFKKITPVEHAAIQQKWFTLQTIEKINHKLFWQAVLVLSLIIIWIVWWNRKLSSEKNKTKDALEELQKTQKILEEKTKDQLAQQEILLEQSKMAAMGEMIGNIAHQWRQPLSVISTGATGMQMQKEYGVLSDELFEKTCENININAQYLSKTIDDFKNFIKGDREKVEFNLSEDINSFISLVKGTIKSNNINIIFDMDDKIVVNSYPNELIQCMINIFNNAKDALEDNNIQNAYIFISTSIQKDKVSIKIMDNAGGIPQEVISKIFEPYFTTKHQSKGTGLGLHMTYNLIVDGMKGNIEVINKSYKHENEKFYGAQFNITIPIH